MTNLTENSSFDDVYQLETSDRALGGPGGVMNRQAQALANRTRYLKNKAEDTEQELLNFKNSVEQNYTLKTEIPPAFVNKVNGQTGDVNLTASDIGAVNSNDSAFITINANNRFSIYSTTARGNLSPYGMGWGNGLDGVFETEIIPVLSGAEPSTRHEIAKELLDFMGIGRGTLYFSDSFNILRVKNISGIASFNTFALHIPWQQIKRQNLTYMVYCRGAGFTFGVDETLTNDNKLNWRLYREVFNFKDNGTGEYTHVDMYCNAADAEMWIALPSIIVGIYPENRKLPVLFNITDTILYTHKDNYAMMHGG